MKKIITLSLFALAMFFSTESLVAQERKIDTNKEALKQTEAIAKTLRLNDKQSKQVYELYKYVEKEKANLNRSEASQAKTNIEKLDTILIQKMESILDEKQFKSYKDYLKNKN